MNHLAGLIRRHRDQHRSRWRRLDPSRQALLALAHLRNGDTYTRLARGFDIGVATAWRHVRQAVNLLAAAADDLSARVKAGRDPQPTAAVVDTQSVKTSANPPTATQGTDAAKKIVGRKRSVVTDTLGLLLAVIVMAASVTENTAGIRVLDQVKATHPTIVKTWVDAGFKNQFVEHAATLGIDAEVVPRNTEVRGFHVVKRRWVVERTLGWLMLHRRLVRDYETHPASSEAMIHIAMIDNVSRRITDESTPTWRGTY